MKLRPHKWSPCLRVTCLAALLAGAVGCTTPVTPRTPKPRYMGTETLQSYGTDLFLECAEPESTEMQQHKLERNAIDRDPLYVQDKANRDQPTSLHIPSVFNVPLSSFKAVDRQGGARPPRVVLQLREREKVLKAKVYHVTTSFHGADGKLVRKESETERFPRYYDWNWHPECRVKTKRPVGLKIGALDAAGGLPHTATGLLDEEGRIVIDLSPFLAFGASRESGLSMVVSCPEEGLQAEIRIPREVFELYLGSARGDTP